MAQQESQPNSVEPYKGIVQRCWRWLFGESAQKVSPTGSAGTTERVIQVLCLLAAVGLLVELAYGFSFNSWQEGASFVVWAWVASLASVLVGVFLGLLFGLPSLPIARPSMPVETPPLHGAAGGTLASESHGTPAAKVMAQPSIPYADQELPYNESSSLEQIADWLTKIIVGLTLTQYETWSRRFTTLSEALTFRLLGRPDNCQPEALCDPSQAVPGASIILSFLLLGFLVTYLWMRRYFIIEMVVGKRQAIAAKIEAKRQALEVMHARASSELEEQRARAAEFASRSSQANIDTKQAEQAQADRIVKNALEIGTAQIDPKEASAALALGIRGFFNDAKKIMPTENQEMLLKIEKAHAESTNSDDPWSGLFGGSAEAGEVRLSGAVTSLRGSANYFEVKLEAAALTPGRTEALAGTTAWFFLHPTFRDRLRPVVFGSDGRAPLELYAWGAFTVGVLLQDGTTLELNLATIPNAPDMFRSR